LIASVRHDPRVGEVPALAAAIDGPARLAIENERLGARVAFQAAELRASRARIVEHADAERRRIERDVHDGAQQHVLALGFELRAAGAGLAAGDPLKQVIERCTAEAVRALDDLRELSHGIYPAALESGGLAPALRSFSDRSSVPVEVHSVPAGRLPPSVERAAFALVADAEAHAEGPIEIVIEEGDGIVDVRIDGVGGAPGGVVPDRVAAVGGSLTVSEHRISAVIPCA
jgi:signal transduction histidine kinase